MLLISLLKVFIRPPFWNICTVSDMHRVYKDRCDLILVLVSKGHLKAGGSSTWVLGVYGQGELPRGGPVLAIIKDKSGLARQTWNV